MTLDKAAVLNASRKRLRSFQDVHCGARAVIIGNGPSLNKMDLSFLKDEITFGMNRIYLGFEKYDFTPTYYVAVNPLVLEQSMQEIRNIPAQRFLSARAAAFMTESDDFILLKSLDSPLFSRDPAEGIWEGYTVTFVALQLAYYMGFEEVYLIGVDHHFEAPGKPNEEIVACGEDVNHFHPAYFGEGVRWHLPDLVNSEYAYSLARFAYEAVGRSVYDATVEGKLNVFPKVDYRDRFMLDKSPSKGILDTNLPPLLSIIPCGEISDFSLDTTIPVLSTQTYPCIELLLPDSDATKPPAALREGWCVHHLEYEGDNPQRWTSHALQQAHGEYVTFMNPNTIYHPDHLSILTGKLGSTPGVLAAFSQLDMVKDSTQTLMADVPSLRFGADVGVEALLLTNPIDVRSLMLRKSALSSSATFEPEYGTAALWDLCIQLASDHPIARVNTITSCSSSSASEIEISDQRQLYLRYRHMATAETIAAQEQLLEGNRSVRDTTKTADWSDAVTAIVARADEATAQRKYRLAATLLASAKLAYPNDPFLLTGHGNLALLVGDLHEARRDFETAIAADPLSSEAHAGLGMALIQLDLVDDGLDMVKRAASLDPKNPTARMILEELAESGVSEWTSSKSTTADLSPNLINLEKTWNTFGNRDPMWAILTREGKENNRWEPGEFFATGIADIERLMAYLDSLSLSIPSRKALDFGCGIGRLTQALAMHFEEVHGVDIAASMVEQARYFNRFGEHCTYHHNVNDDLCILNGMRFDLIYSIITLQHIRPEHIRSYLLEFLRLLNPGGVLIFQLPARRQNPASASSDRSRLSHDVVFDPDNPIMEMNCIPEAEVRALLESANGRIIDMQSDPSLGIEWESFRYCVTKR